MEVFMAREKFLVFGAFFMALLVFSNSFAFGTKELDTEKVAVDFYREVVRGGYQVINAKELKDWIDQKKDMIIIDTMPFEASYKKHHIPGAINVEFPIPEITKLDDKKKEELIKALGPNKEKTIVFYCGFTKCTRSHNGAMWAVKLGYKNVYRQPGGINAWLDADYPVEKSK